MAEATELYGDIMGEVVDSTESDYLALPYTSAITVVTDYRDENTSLSMFIKENISNLMVEFMCKMKCIFDIDITIVCLDQKITTDKVFAQYAKMVKMDKIRYLKAGIEWNEFMMNAIHRLNSSTTDLDNMAVNIGVKSAQTDLMDHIWNRGIMGSCSVTRMNEETMDTSISKKKYYIIGLECMPSPSLVSWMLNRMLIIYLPFGKIMYSKYMKVEDIKWNLNISFGRIEKVSNLNIKMNTDMLLSQVCFVPKSDMDMEIRNTMMCTTKKLEDLVIKTRSERTETDQLLKEEISTVISSSNMQEPLKMFKLSKTFIQTYFNARHDILVDAFAMDMGIAGSIWANDVKFWTLTDTPFADLVETPKLTPDFILCKECLDTRTHRMICEQMNIRYDPNVIILLDIKTTDFLGVTARMNTEMVYGAMAEIMSEEIGRSVETRVITFESTTDENTFTEENRTNGSYENVVEAHRRISFFHNTMLADNDEYRSSRSLFLRDSIGQKNIKDLNILFGSYQMRDLSEVMSNPGTKAKFESTENMSWITQEVKSFEMSRSEMNDTKKMILELCMNSMVDTEEGMFKSYMAKYFSFNVEDKIMTRVRELKERGSQSYSEMPKIFKFPSQENNFKVASVNNLKAYMKGETLTLEDGTVLFRTIDTKSSNETELDNNRTFNEEIGFGFSFDVSEAMKTEVYLDDMCKYEGMKEEMEDVVEEYLGKCTWSESVKNVFRIMMSTKMMNKAFLLQNLAMEMSYLMSRRFVWKGISDRKEGAKVGKKEKTLIEKSADGKKREEQLKATAGTTEMKHISKSAMRTSKYYCLEIKGGTKMTKNKRIRYRIWAEKEIGENVDTNTMEHNWYESNVNSKFVSTKYYSMDSMDLVNYVCVFDKAMMLVQNFISKMLDSESSNVEDMLITDEYKRVIMARVMIMMEHKRGTSDTLSMNRYLFMSAHSMCSDKRGIVSDIGKVPIRSMVQMWVVWKQLSWYSRAMKGFAERMNFMHTMVGGDSTGTFYDYIYSNSFIEEEARIEFSVMMDEMYMVNLFNKDSGSRKHMTPKTYEKMSQDEMMFRASVISENEMLQGKVEMSVEGYNKLMKEKKYHFFDRRSVYTGTKMLMKRLETTVDTDRMVSKIFENLKELATMKSSIEEPCTEMEYFGAGVMQKEKRAKAYDTQRSIIEKKKILYTIEVANMYSTFDLYFGEFAKNQLSGPREILIQDMYTRAKVRLLEQIIGIYCQESETEMISKKNSKYFEQSNAFRQMVTSLSTTSKKLDIRIVGSMNRDHTHWAPATNTVSFMYMMRAMGMPTCMENFMMFGVGAFMHKVIGTPKEMVETMGMRRKMLKTTKRLMDPEMRWMEGENRRNGGYVIFNSGFGQGMLQFTSSLYHCIQKELMRSLLSIVVKNMNLSWRMKSLISSDDNTDMVCVSSSSPEDAVQFVFNMMVVNSTVNRMMNMHENIKKSGFSILISEFNSCYMLGKRILLPTIKFVYTSVEVPDTSFPEDAVKELISMERRLLENGAGYNTILCNRILHRRMLMRIYRLKDLSVKAQNILKVEEEFLPYEVGFLPTRSIIESIIYGPEVYMFLDKDKGRLKEFREKLMSGSINLSIQSMRNKTTFSDEVVSKIMLSLPVKMDKNIKMLRDSYNVSINSMEFTMRNEFNIFMDYPQNIPDTIKSLNKMLFDFNSRYTVKESGMYKLESLVRGLGLVSTKNKLLGVSQDIEVRTMIDFIDKVLRIPAGEVRFSFKMHPLSSFFEKISDFTDRNYMTDIELMRDNSVKKGKHCKMRNITFRPAEEYPNIRIIEIYRLMTKPPIKRTKREKMKVNALKKFYMMDEDLFLPAMMRSKVMGTGPKAKIASNIIQNLASMVDVSNLLMPFECSDSPVYMSNLENYMKYRMFDERVITTDYMESDENTIMGTDKNFCNMISTYMETTTKMTEIMKEADMFNVKEDVEKVKRTDLVPTIARKVFMKLMYLSKKSGDNEKIVFQEMSKYLVESSMRSFAVARMPRAIIERTGIERVKLHMTDGIVSLTIINNKKRQVSVVMMMSMEDRLMTEIDEMKELIKDDISDLKTMGFEFVDNLTDYFFPRSKITYFGMQGVRCGMINKMPMINIKRNVERDRKTNLLTLICRLTFGIAGFSKNLTFDLKLVRFSTKTNMEMMAKMDYTLIKNENMRNRAEAFKTVKECPMVDGRTMLSLFPKMLMRKDVKEAFLLLIGNLDDATITDMMRDPDFMLNVDEETISEAIKFRESMKIEKKKIKEEKTIRKSKVDPEKRRREDNILYPDPTPEEAKEMKKLAIAKKDYIRRKAYEKLEEKIFSRNNNTLDWASAEFEKESLEVIMPLLEIDESGVLTYQIVDEEFGEMKLHIEDLLSSLMGEYRMILNEDMPEELESLEGLMNKEMWNTIVAKYGEEKGAIVYQRNIEAREENKRVMKMSANAVIRKVEISLGRKLSFYEASEINNEFEVPTFSSEFPFESDWPEEDMFAIEGTTEEIKTLKKLIKENKFDLLESYVATNEEIDREVAKLENVNREPLVPEDKQEADLGAYFENRMEDLYAAMSQMGANTMKDIFNEDEIKEDSLLDLGQMDMFNMEGAKEFLEAVRGAVEAERVREERDKAKVEDRIEELILEKVTNSSFIRLNINKKGSLLKFLNLHGELVHNKKFSSEKDLRIAQKVMFDVITHMKEEEAHMMFPEVTFVLAFLILEMRKRMQRKVPMKKIVAQRIKRESSIVLLAEEEDGESDEDDMLDD